MFHPLPPKSLLGAGTLPDDYRTRFPENEEQIRDKIAADMSKEDQLLKRYLEKGRLEAWWNGIVDRVKRDQDSPTGQKRDEEMMENGEWHGVSGRGDDVESVEGEDMEEGSTVVA